MRAFGETGTASSMASRKKQPDMTLPGIVLPRFAVRSFRDKALKPRMRRRSSYGRKQCAGTLGRGRGQLNYAGAAPRPLCRLLCPRRIGSEASAAADADEADLLGHSLDGASYLASGRPAKARGSCLAEGAGASILQLLSHAMPSEVERRKDGVAGLLFYPKSDFARNGCAAPNGGSFQIQRRTQCLQRSRAPGRMPPRELWARGRGRRARLVEYRLAVAIAFRLGYSLPFRFGPNSSPPPPLDPAAFSDTTSLSSCMVANSRFPNVAAVAVALFPALPSTDCFRFGPLAPFGAMERCGSAQALHGLRRARFPFARTRDGADL